MGFLDTLAHPLNALESAAGLSTDEHAPASTDPDTADSVSSGDGVVTDSQQMTYTLYNDDGSVKSTTAKSYTASTYNGKGDTTPLPAGEAGAVGVPEVGNRPSGAGGGPFGALAALGKQLEELGGKLGTGLAVGLAVGAGLVVLVMAYKAYRVVQG